VFDQLLHIYAAVLLFGAFCTAFTIWLAWRDAHSEHLFLIGACRRSYSARPEVLNGSGLQRPCSSAPP
jgi:hypothetical protein